MTAGIRAFYRNPELWVYGILPMAVILVFYSLLMLLLFWIGVPFLTGLLPDPESWSVWLRWLVYVARALIYISSLIAVLLAGIFFLCSLYEAVGALFFDGLVMRFEKERYGIVHEPLPLRKTLRFLLESILFSLITMLWSLLLLIPALYIPIIGILPAAIVVGYRFGMSYLFSSAFADGRGVREIRRLASPRRPLMLGFGFASYFWLLIPFAAIFLLPCFALAGTMLYRERLVPEGSNLPNVRKS